MIPLIVHVFPALAGMNRAGSHQAVLGGGVPRARGDEPVENATDTRSVPCSPRSRG